MSEFTGYIASAAELDENSTYVLPYEHKRLLQQIAKIQAKRGVVATHITDAMEQSSETWHDNAPADALFGEMFQLDTRESGLVSAARRLVDVKYPTLDIGFATIGSRVLCAMHGEEFQLDITGNLPLGSEEEDHGDVERGSIAAPMPKALLGAHIATSVEVHLEGRILEIDVLKIDQDAQRVAYDNAEA